MSGRQNIFDPLGLKDTAFHVLPHCKDRLVSMHERHTDGSITVRPAFPMTTGVSSFDSGGGGAYSTVSEYLRIINVLINGGKSGDGVQILKPETVVDMFKDQVSHLPGSLDKAIAVSMPELSYGPVEMMPGVNKGWVRRRGRDVDRRTS